jgi:hypothetical protein
VTTGSCDHLCTQSNANAHTLRNISIRHVTVARSLPARRTGMPDSSEDRDERYREVRLAYPRYVPRRTGHANSRRPTVSIDGRIGSISGLLEPRLDLVVIDDLAASRRRSDRLHRLEDASLGVRRAPDAAVLRLCMGDRSARWKSDPASFARFRRIAFLTGRGAGISPLVVARRIILSRLRMATAPSTRR